jgi:ATP-dependent Zn protease
MEKTKKRFQFRLKINLWTITLGFLVVFLFAPFVVTLFEGRSREGSEDISRAVSDIKDGKVDKVVVEGNRLTLTYKDGSTKISNKEDGESIVDLLTKSGVDPTKINYSIADQSAGKVLGEILSIVLPLGLMAVFFFFIIRAQSRGVQDIFSFGKSRAKLFAKGKQAVTFRDVAGVEDAKKELVEVVDFLKNPGKYRAIGARTPKGVLLFGLAGVGKTLLAKAVAGEAGVPFFSMAGSEFMEMLVGVGASRVRDLFGQAKAAAPSIIFIDEIDAIGRQRGRGMMGSHDEREQTLNQILVEMDGFTPNDNVVVIAASVTGDTPIVIRENSEIKLVSIGEFVDRFYQDKKGGEVEVSDIECLGFDNKRSFGNLTHNNLYFGNSAFKKVRAVFRHKVDEIYEVEYLGGKVQATGNHSLFVRDRFGIKTKPVSELKKGDVLVDLPFKVNRTNKELREVRAHKFTESWSLSLDLWDVEKEADWLKKYNYAISSEALGLSQLSVGDVIGVSQRTVGNWIRGRHFPQSISRKIYKSNVENLPNKINVTRDLCRLLGYYTAEGYSRWGVEFCFSLDEKELITDTINLMESIFGLLPKTRYITHGAINLVYYSTPVGEFFARLCGKGAHNKHVPYFLFEAPYEYFREYLRGLWLGDGYEDKKGRGEITTMNKTLALEVNWIARMHGVKTYVGGFTTKAGRQISGGKPLLSGRARRIGWGKAANPFNSYEVQKNLPSKRAIVKKVTKLPFNSFVYDLCGVENEAFFGGESPILLHNTNRGDLLDPALLRPGRFDRRVILDMPDKEGRLAILKIHARGKKFARGIKWEQIAERTVGFSGADLENVLNEGAILAARENQHEIEMKDIEEAATKVKLGPAKKRLQSEEDRLLTAYHEAGHAIVTHLLPRMDPVHRISIVARGMSLGHTLIPPAADRTHETKSRILQQIAAMLGGRAAEEVVFNEMTSGAANDIEQATRLARAMVMEFGMSPLGPINLGPQMELGEFGTMEWYERPQVSQGMQEKVDNEVKKIMDTGYKEALYIVKKQRKLIDKIVKGLLKKETLEKDDFEKIVGNKPPRKEKFPNGPLGRAEA